VRARQRYQSFRTDQRRIARQQNHELRAGRDRSPRHEHRVARPALRLLQHRAHAEQRNCRGHVLRLVAHNRDNLSRFERQARAHHVLDQRTPPGAVQHFRPRGLQPRALAGSQYDDCKVGG